MTVSTPFLEDIYPDNLLYAVTIRSPAAKGYLHLIHYPKMPENYSIITARNIPGENKFAKTSMPVLADKILSYIGEPVALLLGPDKTKVEEMAAECKLIVDEEKGVFSCEDAADEKPEISREIIIGNTEEIFKTEGKIVTGSYSSGIQDHWYAEPTGAITLYDNEVLVVKTATQWPYHVKRSIADLLGIDISVISVETTSLGLHMDGKLWYPSLIACHAALGTFITGKPVRLILNREENFYFSPKRYSSNIDIASITDENGKIKASKIDIHVNLGAYEVNGREALDQVCLGCIGNYNFENLSLTAKAHTTNIPPQGPFSGFGLSQGLFAIERHVSQIAGMMEIDPARWRSDYVNNTHFLPAGSPKADVSGEELLNSVTKMSDYYRKWASYELLRKIRNEKEKLASSESDHFKTAFSWKSSITEKRESQRGIGIAIGFQGNDLLYNTEDKGSYSAEVTLTKESVLEIRTSISSSEVYNKIWEKVAMETISIGPDMVRIISDNAPDCGPSCASRNITVVTGLVERCCASIRKKRFHDPLPITVSRSIKPKNGAFYGGLFSGNALNVNGFLRPGQACAVVEISMNIVECVPKIRGIWLAVDGGKIISKHRAKRSLMRSAIQALGWAFTEYIEYSGGILPGKQYDNFKIYSPADIPPVHIDFIQSDSKETKGIGELPFTCIPAAFLQAVSQAMDHYFKSIPLKKKEVWEMIQLKNSEIQPESK